MFLQNAGALEDGRRGTIRSIVRCAHEAIKLGDSLRCVSNQKKEGEKERICDYPAFPPLRRIHPERIMITTELPIESKPKTFGTVGIVAGFIGLLSVLVGPVVRDAIIPPPPAEKQLAETIVSLKQHITAKLKKTPPPPEAPRQRFSPRELPYTLSLALAAVAIIGGAISYLRREDHRYACVACGVGISTLIWHALILALAVAMVCVILYYVLPDALS